ncbi:MAG: hypothetical protein CO189_08715 [candidate division Zixibacteria bacterium CG_4_9_14_3_um_filter_46_8]|nr:MAG: hypothetical protein CO189_08715 [candidate division Zixibacteria bacterium CG_4_9_14_3_um_filter_46_8]
MRLIQKIKISFIRRKYNSHPFSFGDILHKPQRLLVALPSSPKLSMMCGDIITYFKDIFDIDELKFAFKNIPAGELLEFIQGYEVYVPNADQPSQHGLPNAGFLAKVVQFNPQVAIDLEPTRDPFNSIVLLESGAPARLGLDRGFGLPFYNLEIRPQLTGAFKEHCDDMYEFLIGFLNWNTPVAFEPAPEV